jgi:hypothetical protein|tara:strand:- start:306 stop:518 length:213 start_codon:yes stop_codon:yes gene_type:complete
MEGKPKPRQRIIALQQKVDALAWVCEHNVDFDQGLALIHEAYEDLLHIHQYVFEHSDKSKITDVPKTVLE